ncbi:MAG TPA: EfeM/EfeO family lipoprotein, partial [Microthrixaceae bacterium]|nr:EfeM/EfeO family lipoprotein [Microthrixaceae bacterium]
EWSGGHRREKALCRPAGSTPTAAAERAPLADQLVADTRDLVERIGEVEFTVDQLGNGAKELLDEVATGKVTGEEEAWSHTDLWDFQANIDGARLAYQSLRPILMVKDSDLASELDAQFDAAQAALDPYRRGDGFALYTELTADQVKALADAVDSLGEPLSKLTSAVVL